MPSAEDIAKAVWAHRVSTPDGERTETTGNLLSWIDKHAGESLDQAAGPGTKDQRGAVAPTGWEQLGQTPEGKNRSQVDGLAAALAAINTLAENQAEINRKLDRLLNGES